MNLIATDTYNDVTKFEIPWPHYIVDNFLDQALFKFLIKLKHHPNFIPVDSWVDGITKSGKYEGYPQKKSLPLQRDPKLTQLINNCVIKHFGNLLPVKHFCIPDLVKCDPNYSYHNHKDHPDKACTVVVFLEPQVCDATELISDKQKYNLLWKQNRALFFKQEEHGVHNYYNQTTQDRYTLNIYITLDNNAGFHIINNRRSKRKLT